MRIPLGKRDEAGLSLVEIVVILCVLCLIGLLILPLFAKASGRSLKIMCASNLKQAGIAFRVFAVDHDDKYPAQFLLSNRTEFSSAGGEMSKLLWASMSPGLTNTKVLVCPEDVRNAASNFESLQSTNISYFISLDATIDYLQVLVSGDRNLQFDGKDLRPGMFFLQTNSQISWSEKLPGKVGNIGLSDGSVSQTFSSSLKGYISRQGISTNRLAFP